MLNIPLYGYLLGFLCILSWICLKAVTGFVLESHPLGYEIKGTKQRYVVTHGGLANRETMLPIAYALAEKGYHVVVADLPSHGASRELKKDGIQKWKEHLKKEKITNGIGHSLGSKFICPTRGRQYITSIKNTIHIGQDEWCNGRKNIEGSTFRFNIPFVEKDYHLDHLVEPWNPSVISQIPNISNTWSLYIYALLPWSIFVFGMGFAFVVFRSWYQSETFLATYKTPPMFVLYWLCNFAILTYRNLWYPFPNGILDFFLLLVGSLIPVGVYMGISKTWNLQNTFVVYGMHFLYFMSITGLVIGLMHLGNVWIRCSILILLFLLNVCTTFCVYAFVSLLSLEKTTEKLWLISFLSMYLFVLLSPYINHRLFL